MVAQMNSSVRMNPACCLAMVIKSTSQRTSFGKYADDEVAIMGFCYPADNRTNVRELGFIRRQGIVVCSVGQVHLLLRHAVHLCMKSYINMWPSAQMNSSVRMNPVCCLAMVIKSASQRT